MISYQIIWKKSAAKDLRNINKQYVQKIIKSIEMLSFNAFPEQSKKLRGSKQSYRLRVGNYRIIYQISEKDKVIVIEYIRHRRDAYRIF